MNKLMITICGCLLVALLAGPVMAQTDQIWVEDVDRCNIMDFQIPIWIFNNSGEVDLFSLDMTYDNVNLNFVDITPTGLTSGWVVGTEISPGVIQVGGTTVTSPIPQYTEGILVFVNFTCASCVHGTTGTFSISNLQDDLIGYTATDGAYSYSAGCGISADFVVGCNGTVQTTVSLASTNDVDEFSFNLTYDTGMLSFQSCSQSGLLADDWVFFMCNEPVGNPGVLTINGSTTYGGTPVTAGSTGDLVVLDFLITCSGCQEDDVAPLEISGLDYDLTGYSASDGSFRYHCGDPGPATLVAGDIRGTTSDTLQLPIYFLDSPNPVDAMGFTVDYCTDMLQYTGFSAGSLTTGFDYFECTESSPGTILFGGFDDAVIPAGSSGEVLLLNFTVTCGSCVQDDVCTLTIDNQVDDVAFWQPDSGSFIFGIFPIPTTGGIGITILMLTLSGLFIRTGLCRRKR